MKIVISHHALSELGGTETYAITLAAELQRLGHLVMLYAAEGVGPAAEVARKRGLSVTSNRESLPSNCDVLIANDAGTAFSVAPLFPKAVRLYVAHSDSFALQGAPQLEGICHAVIVMSDRVRDFVEARAYSPRLVRLRQPVDLKRFGAFPPRPEDGQRRALLLGNYLQGKGVDVVAAACEAAGFHLTVRGRWSQTTAAPEREISNADVVIGFGRCIIEAMAGRRAAYVYGLSGGDGWVTPESYARLEADGFAGCGLDVTVTPDQLASDLSNWNPEMGEINRKLAYQHHHATRHAIEMVGLTKSLGAPRSTPPTYADELARLVRVEWDLWGRYAGALNAMIKTNNELEVAHKLTEERARQLTEERARLKFAEARLNSLLTSRSWQLTEPLRRLRLMLSSRRKSGLGHGGASTRPLSLVQSDQHSRQNAGAACKIKRREEGGGRPQDDKPVRKAHEQLAFTHDELEEILRRDALAKLPNHDGASAERLWGGGFLPDKQKLYKLDRQQPEDFVTDYQVLCCKNINGTFRHILDNKLMFHAFFAPEFPVARLINYVVGKEISRPLPNGLKFYAKPIAEASGFGVFSGELIDGNVLLRNKDVLDVESLIDQISLHDKDYIITEKIEPHSSLKYLLCGAANSLRILCMRGDRGKAFTAAAVLRVASRCSDDTDNFSAGGLSFYVDVPSGEVGIGRDNRLQQHTHHPETERKLTETQIPLFSDAIGLCKRAMDHHPSLKYVGWDVIVSERGPVIIEGNACPSLDLMQVHEPLLTQKRVRDFYESHGILDLNPLRPLDGAPTRSSNGP